MPKLLFLIITFFTFTLSSYAEDIDNLLNNFKHASDLSYKTKDEAKGNLIIYTRDDLERMQVNTLKDVLKSIRFINYQESRVGQPDLYNADPLVFNSGSVRIYLNNHELYSPLVGSGFAFFGDIGLDFIDHIEVYQGFPSFEFGTEPATIVIRLYSKTSEHHMGSKLKVQGGSYGANSQSVYHTGEIDDISYFAYVSRRDNQRKTIDYKNKELSRDVLMERIFLSLNSENHSFQLHASNMDGNAFMGSFMSVDSNLSSPDSTSLPDDTKVSNTFISAAFESNFQDKTLILNADIMQRKTHLTDIYTSPLAYRPRFNLGSQQQVTSSHQDMDENTYTLGLRKKFETQNNTFTTGIKFRHKRFDISDASLNSYLYTPPSTVSPTPTALNSTPPYKKTDIYSMFAQDQYSIDETQLFTISLMVQHYNNRHTTAQDYDLFQRRAGYVYTEDTWLAKTFISHEEFAPEPYFTVTGSGQYSNVNLKKSSYLSASQELSYNKNDTLSKIVLSYTKARDLHILDHLKLNNSSEDNDIIMASFEETFSFNTKDKLELQAYVVSLSSPFSNSSDSTHGGMIRMLNTYSKLDLFNELIIREKSSAKVKNSHDYSAGLIYHISQDFQLNIKGENLLDNSYEQTYIDQIYQTDKTTIESVDYLIAPVIERRFWLGMELLF